MSSANKPTFPGEHHQQQQKSSGASPSSPTTTTTTAATVTAAEVNPLQYETIESLRAQLALAQENYKRQIKNLRHDKEVLQHEIAATKSDCALLGTRLDDAVVRARNAEESEKKVRLEMEVLAAESKDKMESLRERQSDAPAIDEAIFKNYKEMRTLLFDRCGAEFMSVEEQWHFARSNPLAVLEMTRQWIWKFTECFETVTQQVELQKQRWREDRSELLGALDMVKNNQALLLGSSPNSPLGSNRRRSYVGIPVPASGACPPSFSSSSSAAAAAATMQNANSSNFLSGFSTSSTKSKVVNSSNQQQQRSGVAVGGRSNNNNNNNNTNEDNTNNVSGGESVDQLQQRIQVLRRECALSKTDSLRAHKAVTAAEQKQRHLQQMLEKAHKQLQEAVEATSSSTVRKQVDEVKKQMRLAIGQKDDEISSLKMQFEKDVVALTKQIQGLSDQNSKADRLHAQLTIQRSENRDLKSQLARTDVKTLEDHKKRADRELMELRSHTSNLESTVDTLKLRLAAAKQLAVDAKQKYSALFDAHLQEAKSRQTEAAKMKMKQIRRDVVGSDSALTKFHFEQKYQALSQELAATQQKLKRLIMIAHHDQVAHDAEIEQMQMQAVSYYESQQRKEEAEFWASEGEEGAAMESGGRGRMYLASNAGSAGKELHHHHHQRGGGNSPPSTSAGGGGQGNARPQSAYNSSVTGAVAAASSPATTTKNSNNSNRERGGRATERNLFHAEGALREQLQQNVIVGENRTVVEEINRVVGEGIVQDARSWTPQPGGDGARRSAGGKKSNFFGEQSMLALSFNGTGTGARTSNATSHGGAGFEVSTRTALAASVAKSKNDLTEYFNEREKQEANRQQKKVSLATMGHQGKTIGEFVSPGGLSSRDPAVASPSVEKKPPRPAILVSGGGGGGGGGANSKINPTSNSVQFFIEGSTTPMGVRERRVL